MLLLVIFHHVGRARSGSGYTSYSIVHAPGSMVSHCASLLTAAVQTLKDSVCKLNPEVYGARVINESVLLEIQLQ